VIFTCPIVKELKPVLLVDEGKIRRIRGIAYTTRVAPSISSRIIDAARSILNKYHQDIFIYADNYKGMESGL
jgi:RNA 3'-terminal phosphate cyclase-like protein